VLHLKSAAFGTDLGHAHIRGVVDEDGTSPQDTRRVGELPPFRPAESAGSKVHEGNITHVGEHARSDIFIRHFQGENRHRGVRVQPGRLLGDVQGESGLSHGRTRRQKDQFRRFESAHPLIQPRKAAADAQHRVRIFGEDLHALQRLVDGLANGNERPVLPGLGDGEDRFLRPLHDFRDRPSPVVAVLYNAVCRGDQLPQKRPVLHNPEVFPDMRRGGHIGVDLR